MGEYAFSDVITSMDALREIIGQPGKLVIDKVQPEIDEMAAEWIAASPFLVIGTSDADGRLDVSPKGDPAGFVRVLDSKTLIIPDRPGNRRVDTIGNILQHPNVGLIFLVPGKAETLRINGRAQIVRDADLREQCAVDGKAPTLLIAVRAEEVYFHCGKCMYRSQLWDSADAPANDNLPTLAEILIKQTNLDAKVEDFEAEIETEYRTELY